MSRSSPPSSGQTFKVSDLVSEHLPFLRRYARALTGSQETGDAYALATLEAILAAPNSLYDENIAGRVALYRIFHSIWQSSGAPVQEEEDPLAQAAQNHLKTLIPKSREALLLSTIEEFNTSEIAQIMQIEPAEIAILLQRAHQEMEQSTSGRVLIIEDEAIISMDLQEIVADLGHKIVGVARTHKEATTLAHRERPDLILSDIQLADNSSGIDAVNDILKSAGDIPVIFITAFPARLLTAERPEPAFLISKPYREEQVRAAISQAMFFSSLQTYA